MRTSPLFALLGPFLAAAAAAAPPTLLPPQAGDLVPGRLIAAKPFPGLNPSRESVTFSWALPPETRLSSPLSALSAASREHWVQVTGAELESGVPLFTLSPGAVVRLSPLAAGTAVPDAANLVIEDTKGARHGAGAAFEALASADQLAAAGMEVAAGSLAFRLRPEVGAAGLVLRSAPGVVAAADRFVVHVLDAGSSVEAQLTSGRAVYLDGELLVATLTAGDAHTRLALREVTAFVISPSGQAWPLRFAPSPGGRLSAELRLDARAAAAPGPWQIEVAALGEASGQPFRRNARVAFGVSAPTARLSGEVGELRRPAIGGLEVQLGVETSTAGRYEVRAVLYGTDNQGGLKPAAVAHGAAWLEAGPGTLGLHFDAKALAGAGLKAPYELRQLELRDQGRMSLLEHRARAWVME